MTEGVRTFLDGLGLSQYHVMFLAKGFDSESDVMHLNGEDLDSMYIVDAVHRKEILGAASQFKPTPEFALFEWLREKGLVHYYINFVQSELTDFATIARLNLPNPDLYDELELVLPGHRRRLERAVRQLTKKQRMVIPSWNSPEQTKSADTAESRVPVTELFEMPVAYGRWGKPKCLEEAKYDFLMLDATVASTVDPQDKVEIEFMIDSGSDVVTIRQEVLDTLDLELIGPIKSKGVHASKTKNLYRANIMIGSQLLEIEVMGESYDSIGSRVIRNFRHYISGSRHVWLKGDFTDPTLASKEIQQTQDSCTTSAESSSALSYHEQYSEQAVPLSHHALTVPVEGLDESNISLQSDTDIEETNTSVEKDFALIREPLEHEIHGNNKGTLENIKFQFSTKDKNGGEENQDISKYDETDLLLVHTDDIIDVRPFIAANRKKIIDGHVQFRDVTDIHSNGDTVLVKPSLELTRNNVLHSKSNNCNDATNKQRLRYEGDTVLGKRAVYYRSAKSNQSANR